MNKNNCPKLEKCPIYINDVTLNDVTQKTYRNLYCLAGENRFKTCKRFIVSNLTDKPIPTSILPNSSLSIEDIIDKINNL